METETVSPKAYEPCSLENHKNEYVIVKIPNLFVSFLAEEPEINPHYGRVKLESEAWINEFCNYTGKTALTISKCDFSYFMAITAPEADVSRYRTLCDWGNWVFPYDDMFDNGVLRNDPKAATKVMADLMRPMLQVPLPKDGSKEERATILKVHDIVWHRLQEGSSIGTTHRFAKAMSDYGAGVLAHVEDSCTDKILTPEDMLATRQLSAGASPIFPLVEYANDLHLPDYVFDDPIIQRLAQLVTDFVVIINDMLSYMKEEAELVPHNIVAVARMNGFGPQEAFDYVGDMLNGRHRQWEDALDFVPSWGAGVDRDVARYIQGISNVAKANLYWSFKSQRYLGSKGQTIRQTRLVEVLRSPAFLGHACTTEALSKSAL